MIGQMQQEQFSKDFIMLEHKNKNYTKQKLLRTKSFKINFKRDYPLNNPIHG